MAKDLALIIPTLREHVAAERVLQYNDLLVL